MAPSKTTGEAYRARWDKSLADTQLKRPGYCVCMSDMSAVITNKLELISFEFDCVFKFEVDTPGMESSKELSKAISFREGFTWDFAASL